MFVTVKHGADRSNLFNPDCCVVNFMDSIRRCCAIADDKLVDLTDEKGKRIGMRYFRLGPSPVRALSCVGGSFVSCRGDYIS